MHTISQISSNLGTIKDEVKKKLDELDSSELYSKNDVLLGISNVACIVAHQIPLYARVTLGNAIYLLHIPGMIAEGYRNWKTFNAIPDKARLEKFLSVPIISLMASADPLLNAICSIAKLIGIAKGISPRHKNCCETRSLNASFGWALHTFNLTMQAFRTIMAIDELADERRYGPSGARSKTRDDGYDDGYEEWEKRYHFNFNEKPPTCSDIPESKYEKMSDMERLGTAGFDTKSPCDAAKAMKVEIDPKCESATGEGIKEACFETCRKIHRAFTKLFGKVHPDKNPGNPEAQTASVNLVNFKETLDERYECSQKNKN